MHISIKSGALIPVLVMLPNVLWMVLPRAEPSEQTSEPLFLTVLENIGRVAVLILPFFFSLDLNRRLSTPIAVGMGLALALYYASWTRYFVGGRSAHLLAAPLLGIPLPLATAPTLFLVLSSYLMDSWLMFAASVWFGVAHIWVSALAL
jgi:hypothetical protein